ncbi:DUF4389 domain-containing protein [Actinomadura spongiicola]|uniref:DUF4389 domain-containing protein n=1 Tax=Actinomadura spongiicola TaxID=2303421 RepID=UPI002D780D84|nr:DUF4389 domain-containing protein [Actinomadura spongiicola]
MPHYVVQFFLGIAVAVLTVVAFFAILFTGRYPRSIFEFNVGVPRWAWRVAFYGYGALGTDRYPPFTLKDVPDYPARLSVDYPEELSRRLALLKWWLLAIPHYMVIALFVGGLGGDRAYNAPGLVGVLVLVAAVALLFTTRYLRGVFDLLMGIHRWVLRVAGYALLLTDRYPPFRLDMGAAEPAAAVTGRGPEESAPGR